MDSAVAARAGLDAHVRTIVAIHFDPATGAPYWRERARTLGLDARDRIRGFADLPLLGPMDEEALRDRSVLDFVPVSRRDALAGAIVAETGGATGRPKRTVFSRREFHQGFVAPFVAAADLSGFPRGGPWLFAGPGGPHVIGQAAAACATALASPQPFAIDLDPRWFRRLPPDTTGRARYLAHLIEQAMAIIAAEPIEVLFTTPVLLAELAQRMTTQQRKRIRGVHYGGMRVTPEVLLAAQTEWFADAVHLAGYGNSLFGVCMEFGGAPDRVLRYHPFGWRHQVRLDEEGRVWMSRLDETVLIPNLPERDCAAAAEPPPALAEAGFQAGVSDPHPRQVARTAHDCGIY